MPVRGGFHSRRLQTSLGVKRRLPAVAYREGGPVNYVRATRSARDTISVA